MATNWQRIRRGAALPLTAAGAICISVGLAAGPQTTLPSEAIRIVLVTGGQVAPSLPPPVTAPSARPVIAAAVYEAPEPTPTTIPAPPPALPKEELVSPTAAAIAPPEPAAVEAASQPSRSVGDQALDLLAPFAWQARLPGWTVDMLPSRSGVLGYTWPYEKRIEIYVRDYQEAPEVALTAAHEIAHALDVTHLTDSDRAQWLALRGIPADTPWWAPHGATDFAFGQGDFAESMAVCLVGGSSLSRLGDQPTAQQCEWLLGRWAA